MPETNESKLTRNQKRKVGPREYTEGGRRYRQTVELRYDDDCNNGHNTFAITSDTREFRLGGWSESSGGCEHESIAEHFPELAKYIKWHLCSSDGPMHYPANALYHAGDRDHWGLRKGEPDPKSVKTRIVFGDNPIQHKINQSFAKWLQVESANGCGFNFNIIAIPHTNAPGQNYKFGPKYTFNDYAGKWHECPFDEEADAQNFLKALQSCNPQFVGAVTSWRQAQIAQDLAAAKSCAIWPDATDEDLTSEGLKDRLNSRLPALLVEFRAAMEELGFTW